MAIETLAVGYQSGVSYTVDHDNTAGTLGITITGALISGKPMFANVTFAVGGLTVSTGVLNVTADIGQGRTVLLTNASLVGVTLNATTGNGSSLMVTV